MAVSIGISIKQNSQNVANNTSNVTVTVTASWTGGSWNSLQKPGWLKIDGATYNFTSSFNASGTSSGSQTLFSKTVNITHGSDGKKTLSCSASYTTGVSSGTVTDSASKTLTTIPRTSSWATAANGTLGTAQTLKISRQSSTFKHKLVYSCGTVSGYIAGSSTTFTTATSFTWTPPLSLASQNTAGTSVSIKLTLRTYDANGNGIGSVAKTISCAIPSSVKPSCTVTVTDAMGYESTYGGFIKGISKFHVVVKPTTSYGSAIASYSTTANGSTYTKASFDTAVVKTVGNNTIKAIVKDKRERTGTASVTKTVIDYAEPNIRKLSVKRCDQNGTENGQGEYVQVTFSTTVSDLNNKNGATYKIRYKKSSDSTYTEVSSATTSSALSKYNGSYSVTDGTFIFAADSGSSYNVEFEIVDNFSTVSRTTSASTGFTLMHWLASGTGMAIGKVAEAENVFDVGLNSYFRKDVCIGNRTGHHDGKTGVYIDAEGFMHLQRDIGQGYYPYIGFSLNTATTVEAHILYDGAIKFKDATDYDFDNTLYTTGNVTVKISSATRTIGFSGGKSTVYMYSYPTANSSTTVWGIMDSTYGHMLNYTTEDYLHIYPKLNAHDTITAQSGISVTGNVIGTGNIQTDGYVRGIASLRTDGRIYSQGTYNETGTAAANVVISNAYWTYRSSSSSRRYKHDINPLSEELNSEKLLSIPVKEYIYNLDYISEEDQRYNTPIPGFIAEDMYEHYPIAVEIKDGMIEDWNHRMIIPPMLDLIQKLWTKVEKLEENTA